MILSAGAQAALPPGTGTGAWRIASGTLEIYLVSPERRRLVALLAAGNHFPALPDGPLALALVALEDTELLPAGPHVDVAEWTALASAAACIEPPATTDPTAFAALLDAAFAARDRARDERLAGRLGHCDDMAASGSLADALLHAAATFGLDPDPRVLRANGGDQADPAAAARIAGMRAARVVLEPGWWNDDAGPLLLRREDGAILAALWRRGAYRDAAGGVVDPATVDPVAWALYPPLAGDISTFRGMAAGIARGLRREMPLIGSAALGAALLGLLVPIASGWIFDTIVPSGAGGLLVSAGLALLVAAIVSAVFAAVRALAVARVAGRGQAAMAAGVSDRVLRLPARFFKTLSAGDFNQRIDALDTIRRLVTETLLSAGLTLLFALIYLVLLFLYDVPMALAGLGLTLVYVAAVAIGRIAQTGPLREAADRDGRLAGLTFEILEGLPKLRSAAAEPRALARWSAAYALERRATAKGQRAGIHFDAFADSWHVVTLIGLFATAALLVSGDVPPGRFIAFLTAFAVFQNSLTGFCESLMQIYTARPLADRARPILTAEPEAGIGRADPGRLSGDIQVSGLSFGYDRAMSPLLDGVALSIAPGEHVAIVGGSGSGKSTILRLLLGFETPVTGSIAYDGQELASLDPARVRAQIGVVLQSSQLFAGSIMENIRGASGATLEQCTRAADRAGLAGDLAMMPMGLHTPVTEGAGTLSGGQRQRILIARALAAEPRILFFDEATSALDNATQAIVAGTLDALRATRITIAHRLSTVRHADRICVLERGRFVESGTFADLMARDGAFARLARRQLLEE